MHGRPSWRMNSAESQYVFSIPRLLYHFSQFFFAQLTCDGDYVVPRNVGNATKYPYKVSFYVGYLPLTFYVSHSTELGPNQVCTLFGAQPGSRIVTGKDYIQAGYNLNTDDLWRRNFVVLFAFLIFFWLTQTVVIELYPVSTNCYRSVAHHVIVWKAIRRRRWCWLFR